MIRQQNEPQLELSQAARDLLEELSNGDGADIAVPSVYAGAMALATHAQAYLDVASQLCAEPRSHDFAVFGAFYGIRHGLELWFKCIIINDMIDRTLEAISGGAVDLDALTTVLDPLSKKQKEHLCRSLCAVRNVQEDKTVAPDCYIKNVSEADAVRAIAYVKTNGKQPRYILGYAWSVPIPGHSLQKFWLKAQPIINGLRPQVASSADRAGCGRPTSIERLFAAVELFDKLDPDGDTFRYPSSLTGAWNTQLPCVSLRALGDLAEEIRETVLGYESLLAESYSLSTLRSPRPRVGEPFLSCV
jgi:hypothetical protein